MKPFQQWDRAVLMISSALIGLALACSDGASPGVHGANSLVVGPAVDIQIAPTSAALTLGGHSVLRCAAFDAQGVMVSSDRTWTSSDPSVASVASDGSLTALRPGGALVTCQIGGRSATSAITVSTATVAFVEVSPGAGTIPPGASLPLVGVPRDSFGIPVPGSNVQWSSADTAVAVVDAVGVVSARAAGDADIRAVSGGVAGTTKIKVTPIAPPPVTAISISVDATSLNAGQMAHASATTMDATGQSVSGRSIKWSASNPAVLSVVTANAVKANVRALTQGTATLTATSEGKSASVSLTVGAPTVASIATSLASPSIQVGHGTLASAVPLDGMGNPMTGQTATWTSLDPSIATVSSSGVVTGIAAGSVIIRATSNGITGDATLTVTPPSVAFVTTTLAPSSLATGQTTQATAVVMDAGGNTLSGRSVAWSSLNPNIATVSIAGVVTAVAPGSAVIRATVESKTGDATLVVNAPTPPTNPTNPTNPPPTNPPPTNPPPTNPPPTPAAQAVDTGAAFVSGPKTWANGNGPAVPVQTPLSPGWTATIPGAQWVWRTAVVANPMAAEVDTFTHRFVLNTSGAFTLDVASDNGFSVIVNGTVIADRLLDGGATYAAASHYPIPTTALVGGVNVLMIVVRNAPNPASSDPAQNPAGLIYRLALSANAPPTPGPTATVVVTIDSASLIAGHTAHVSVVPKDASGTPLGGKTPVWASQNPSIATVTETGVVTGVSAGSTRIQATIDGIVGSAPLAVTVPPVVQPPPVIQPNPNPSPGHPNEPAGFAQQTAWSGDALENGDFYPSAPGGGNLSIISDPSVVAAGGSSANVGQMTFPGGMGSGSAPGNLWVKRFFHKDAIYVSFLIKIDPNYNGNEGAGANKILYWEMLPLNEGSSVSGGSIEFGGIGTGTGGPFIVPEGVTGFVQGPDNPNGAPPTVILNPNKVPQPYQDFTRGVWHHYEVLFVNNTPGHNDGTIKFWLDGVLHGDYTNRIGFQQHTANPTNFTDVYFSPTYGGGGPPVPHNMWMYLKDLYISGK